MQRLEVIGAADITGAAAVTGATFGAAGWT